MEKIKVKKYYHLCEEVEEIGMLLHEGKCTEFYLIDKSRKTKEIPIGYQGCKNCLYLRGFDNDENWIKCSKKPEGRSLKDAIIAFDKAKKEDIALWDSAPSNSTYGFKTEEEAINIAKQYNESPEWKDDKRWVVEKKGKRFRVNIGYGRES
jgi:hypothetical protein